MFKDLLQGKPIRHPIHPILIHFPVGLLLLSLVLDVVGLVRADPVWVRGAFYSLWFGVLTALLAAVPGLVDYLDIRRDHPAKKTATFHMVLNLAAVGLYVVNGLLRWRELERSSAPVLPFVLSLIGIGILGVSGYLGGHIVYNDGIGVGRHRRRTPTPRQTIRLSSAGSADGFVAAADAGSLRDGETLRVELDGEVMTVANVGGRLFALQEFCTHRFGPLSEGTFCDGQVVCPWHRSRFDVRNGQVTHGPAKVDLKTYEAVERAGKILVRARAARQA